MGPTYQQYLGVPATFRQQHIADYKVSRPHATDAQATEEADKWERQVTREMKSKLVRLKPKDREMIRAFEKGGWLQYEPIISAEIATMKHTPSQFRFANLADIDIRCLRQWMETQLAEHCPLR